MSSERYPGGHPEEFFIFFDRPYYPYSEQKFKEGGNMFGIGVLKHKFELMSEDLRLIDKKCDYVKTRVDNLWGHWNEDRKGVGLASRVDFLNATLDGIKAGNQRLLKEQEEFKKKVESDLRAIKHRLEELEANQRSRNEVDDAYALAEDFRRWYADFVKRDEKIEAFHFFVNQLREKYKITKL